MIELSPDPGFDNPSAWRFHQEWFHDSLCVPVVFGSIKYTYPIAGMGLVPGVEYRLTVKCDGVTPGIFSPPWVYLAHGSQFLWQDNIHGSSSKSVIDFVAEYDPFESVTIIARNYGSAILRSMSVKELPPGMISHKEIRQGIRGILLSINDPNMPLAKNIAWENHSYKPVDGIPWIRETLLPGEERQAATDTIRSVGIMQYDLFWPANKGTEAAEDLVDTIKDAFKPITTIGVNSLVFRAERLSGTPDEKWYRIPIRLTWRAHAIG